MFQPAVRRVQEIITLVQRKRFSRQDKNRCRFCRANRRKIDYKDVGDLEKLSTSQGKLFSRKRSGNCAKHQRQAKRAVKRARYMALLSYTGE